VLFFPCTLSLAQAPSDSERLYSTSAGRQLYEIAYESVNSEDINGPEIEQALTLLMATTELDRSAKYVLPEMIRLASRHPDRDYSELLYQLLMNYVDKSAELEVIREGVSHLLGSLSSREEREKLLEKLLKGLGGKNKTLDSELATELGLLTAEKAELEAAQSYFLLAYDNNRYNKLAFAKLAEVIGDQIKPAFYLEHLRSALSENPLDMQGALAFAEYAEKLQLYETAADAYEYCADLFRFLNPSEALPASLYLPWAMSSYNTQRGQNTCLQIALEVRQSGRFDLLLEAIAGRAALKIGNSEEANRVLQAAASRATRRAYKRPAEKSDGKVSEGMVVSPFELAWFYCFALPDANKAVEWSNKAYSTEPNSATAAALLACALVMGEQTDWAKPLVDNYERNQIGELALAQIQLAQGQKDEAIETLKSAIEREPGSLAAERAKAILTEQGGAYLPSVDRDVVLTMLGNSFGKKIVPDFIIPAEIISVHLKLRGSKFSYGSKFGGSVVIRNNSADPLVISDSGLFKGNIRVDARIGGDLNKNIPNLVSLRFRPASPIAGGESISIPVRLVTGQLRQILLGYPQASLNIEFSVFLDPAVTNEGQISNRVGIKPAAVVVRRPGIELGGKYLQNRLDSLSTGQQGQKIKTVRLVTGLLMEQQALAYREPLYKFKSADWMPELLKSALLHSLGDEDWVVRVHAMDDLVNAVSDNLNDSHWPSRLMAISLLSKSPTSNFGDVLDWTAKYDSNNLVRQMAVALGGKEPEPPEPEQPSPASPENPPPE
jgi:tetratricopeptide (TPR) repeat protein